MKLVFGFLAAAFLVACQGMVPQGAGPSVLPPLASQKEADSDTPPADAPPAGTPPAATPPGAGATGGAGAYNPPPVPTDMIAVNDKPHSGGVSALPADVNGGETASRTPFDFTLSGAADPICEEPSAEKRRARSPLATSVRYDVHGAVGAVLLDGTPVPLNDCDAIVLRFQEGTGASAHCEDTRLNENCQFNWAASFRHADQVKAYLFVYPASDILKHMQNPSAPDPDYRPCGADASEYYVPDKDEITFSESGEPLAVCGSSPLYPFHITIPGDQK